ncbi:multidrug resistance efflux transporter family protein [Lysobacter humi (ex Lee et al. 2017)]
MSAHARATLIAVAIALLSALFFTSTYVLNRAAAVDGGHWAWTAALRYLITAPLMLPLVLARRGSIAPVAAALRAAPLAWLGWSAIGFVLFYVCLSWAAASGPSWLVAGTFQLTVVAGMLCAPFLYDDARRRVPPVALALGLLAVGGVLLMQFAHAGGRLDRDGWLALGAVAVSAVAYPLGNRGLLLHLERRGIELDAVQRVFGMTVASLPAWLAIAAWAGARHGAPSLAQVGLAAGVALGAGVIATVLFFEATGRVRRDPTALAAAEAMQAAEILFACAIGALWLGEAWPRGRAAVGALVVILAIVLFSAVAARARPAT